MKDYLFYASAVAVVAAGYLFYNKLEEIDTNLKSVEIQSIVSSGKAIYMPGNVCILRATSDITVEKMREFAAACVQSHEDWLKINEQEPSYSDGDTDRPFQEWAP